jgi:hypothetical protein
MSNRQDLGWHSMPSSWMQNMHVVYAAASPTCTHQTSRDLVGSSEYSKVLPKICPSTSREQKPWTGLISREGSVPFF